ncbi:Hint domain-containing protein [Streptomyces sp. NK08204]|uniref:Hint domain-containing protein n=1 Tax=Streptomyces sp. NK08204 TaxID=2873260 RepID=UPI001CED5601|nr:Hint domain-containing protein [Streptomyces sp. NK08204]
MWFYGASHAEISYFLKNYCKFLHCNSPVEGLLTGHLVESPFHSYALQDTITNSLLAGEAYRGKPGRTGSVGCNHSFVDGTQVLLADGRLKRIEDVKIGDKVVTTDPKNGKTTAYKVVATILTKDDKNFVALTVKGGKIPVHR